MLIAYILVQAYISTHSLTRRLTIIPPRHTATVSYFNSQPHKEADMLSERLLVYMVHFNSQPHKEADSRECRCRFLNRYFNSQPHKEADSS